MELVCIDFLYLEPDTSGQGNVLVVTDHLLGISIPNEKQWAVMVAKILVENFVVHYGLPQRIHSGQGRDFERLADQTIAQLSGHPEVIHNSLSSSQGSTA